MIESLLPEHIIELLPFVPTLSHIVFIPIALFVSICALLVVFAPNLFHSALSLVGTLFGVAGVYALLEAEFLAVSQIMVYVGAIATLITFAIMLTRGMMFGRTSPTNTQTLTAILMVMLFFFVLMGILIQIPWPEVGVELPDGEMIIADLGELFVTTYLVPFELMALLLLVSLAGALMLARDRW